MDLNTCIWMISKYNICNLNICILVILRYNISNLNILRIHISYFSGHDKDLPFFQGEIGEIYLLLTFGFQITTRRIFYFYILTIL